MFDRETKSAYVFRLYNMKESGGHEELGIELWMSKVGKGIVYDLKFDNVERWRGFFGQVLEAGVKAAKEVGERLPVEDRLPYMLCWVNSDVAISEGRLVMGTSHLWQLAETHALFGWSYVTVRGVNLTLEGPKPQFYAYIALKRLDEAIRRSAEGGWLKMLGVKAESWEGLKGWVVGNWDVVVDAGVSRLGEGVRSVLEALRDMLDDDKIAREVVAPALLLIQAERLGVNETTLKYFGVVASGAIGGDGYVSAAEGKVVLTSGMRAVALLWAAALAAHSIKTKVENVGSTFNVAAFGDDAVKLASLYFLYGPPLLEGDDRLKNHKLAEAMKLGAEGLNVSWEGLKRTKGGVAADLTISEGGIAVRYNVYLREKVILLQFASSDRGRVELAARLLRLAGVGAEVKRVSGRDVWQVWATTDMLVAGRKELRDAVRKVVEGALEKDWVDEKKARRWLEKLGRGVVAWEGKKFEMRLVEGALVVRFSSTSRKSVEDVVREFKAMGLEEDVHFAVRWSGERGRVYLLAEGVRRLKWVSTYGEEGQRQRAAEFLKFLEEKAKAKGAEVFRKLEALLEEGRSRGALRLVGLERDGVKVLDVKTEEKDDKLYVTIKAEVDGAAGQYKITFYREGGGAKRLRFYVRGEEAVARAIKLVEVLTGEKPQVTEMPNGKTEIRGSGRHIDAMARYEELREAIEKWSNR